MAENKKVEPYASGADMWREYAADYGVITAAIICHRYLDMQERLQADNTEEMVFCRQLREEMESAPNMVGVDVYKYSERLAELNSEAELYKASDKANYLCAGDIDDAIHACEFGDGSHEFKPALDALVDRYGLERLSFVLACEVRFDSVFGRYPDELYKWAHDMNINENYGSFGIRTRPDVLAGLIAELRKEEISMDKETVQAKIENMVISFYEKHVPDYQPIEKEKIITEIQETMANNDYAAMSAYLQGLTKRMVNEDAIENAACDYSDIIYEMEKNDPLLQAQKSAEIAEDEARYAQYEYQQTHPGMEDTIIMSEVDELPDMDKSKIQASGETTKTYTLDELMKIMEPQNRRDKALMCECIDGLGMYAALQAKENSNTSKIAEMRDHIENFVEYWGLNDGENAKPLEDFLTAFDERVHEALFAGEITGDVFQSRVSILNGLYRHGQEMVVAQGDLAMGDILAMGDLMKEVAAYFDFETDMLNSMVDKLVSEVRKMLKDFELPGQAVNGDNVHNYFVKQAVLFDNDRGFAFAHNPNAVSPFVTWQTANKDGVMSYETGHYFSTREKALVDYISRATDYKDTYKVKEKPLPEIPKRLIRFIDSEYRELFQIPDGGSIRVTYPPGDGREPVERACKFLDEYHTDIGNNVYHICEWAERMEAIGAKYEPVVQLQSLELVPFTAGEDKFYKPNREEGNTCVGIISGNFGNGGDRYHANWNDRESGGYTAGFQAELQSVIYALRQNLLKDDNSMKAYCQDHPEAKLPESDKFELYGFKLETETRQYFVRCFAEQDSHFAIYAYGDKPAPVIEQAVAMPLSGSHVQPEQERGGGKSDIKDNDGYTSVLKAIEDGKKTPKPRKPKEPGQRKNKDEEL